MRVQESMRIVYNRMRRVFFKPKNYLLTKPVTTMKKTESPTPATVAQRAEKETVSTVRVSDMGMRIKASKGTETTKKQSAVASA